jgi:DNA-directed RNA polymerase specialized sigma24 family protein
VQERSERVAVVPVATFVEFYRKEYRAVVALAYALSGNWWIGEELAQEAFIRAHRNWARLATYDEPGAWVRRVVTNLSVSAIRRRMVEARALVRLGLGERHCMTDSPGADPDFWEAVRSLPRRQAQVVALHYLEDLSVAQVAEILEMAPGTVKKHLFDGRRGLARRLRTEGGEA